MSIEVMTHVWKYSQHKGSALLTLLAIADCAHDDGTNAYPSIGTLAEKTRMTERNVQLVLKTLEASQELAIKRNAGPNGCHLFMVRMSPLPVSPKGQRVKSFRGEIQCVEGVKSSALLQPQISPNPSLDPSEDPEKERSSLTTFESSADMGETPRSAPASAHTNGVALAGKGGKTQRPKLPK